MKTQSLLIVFTSPPKITAQEALLEDHVSTAIDGIPVFGSVAPWNPMHDLLIDRETQTLAGIVYPVVARERAAIAAICRSLSAEVVRYCVSPARAALILRDPEFQRKEFSETGDANVLVNQFPEALRPYRQLLRGCLAGEIDPEQFPAELRTVAARYFEENAAAEHLEAWSTGGGIVDRVEVTWVNKPVDARLPSYFPSDFTIELAQYFAEDIWFYREDNNEVHAIGVNYVQPTLDAYGLKLPSDLC